MTSRRLGWPEALGMGYDDAEIPGTSRNLVDDMGVVYVERRDGIQGKQSVGCSTHLCTALSTYFIDEPQWQQFKLRSRQLRGCFHRSYKSKKYRSKQ
jgi:hypothetical protein